MIKKALLVIALLTLNSCSESIPGNPEKVAENYVEAIRADDFAQIYELNFLTVRQKRLLLREESDAGQKLLEENFKKHKGDYESVDVKLTDRGIWHEKSYFPKSAKVTFGKASYPKAAADDPVNAEYEKAQNVYVKIKSVYSSPEEAPVYDDKKIKEVSFDCFLKKVRKEGNVRIYSHDEQWFVADIVPDVSTAIYFE
ncbi:MAG: hypothetical protein OEY64_01740 [Nitrospinota bacterium]|nr:hypothetical protein [Nitrospinota bacterium]